MPLFEFHPQTEIPSGRHVLRYVNICIYVYNLVLHVGNCFSLGKWNYYCGVPRFVKNIVVRL